MLDQEVWLYPCFVNSGSIFYVERTPQYSFYS